MALLKMCCVDDCGKHAIAKFMCSAHYYRTKKHGSPDAFKLVNVGQGKTRKECSVDGCQTPAKAKGMCMKHYDRLKNHGTLEGMRTYQSYGADQTCGAEGCSNKIRAKGFCSKHYERFKKHGNPNKGGVNFSGKFGERLGCLVGGCEKHAFAKGMCQKHYARVKKHGDPHFVARKGKRDNFAGVVRSPICTVPGCDRPHQSLGYCSTHYQRHRDGKETNSPIQERIPRQRYIDANGYVLLGGSRNGSPRYEHREVMEAVIGRKLLPGETVHHKNGVRSDNRPDNLELWVTSQPAGQRPEDLVAWAREILALYGPLVPEPGSPPALRVVA